MSAYSQQLSSINTDDDIAVKEDFIDSVGRDARNKWFNNNS